MHPNKEIKSSYTKTNVEIVKNLVTSQNYAEKQEPNVLTTKETLQDSALDQICPFCDHTCLVRKEHIQHIKDNHARGPPYKCPSCSYTNIKLQKMLAHCVCHANTMACTQEGCEYKTKSVNNLKKHEKNHNTDAMSEPFSCKVPDCGYITKSVHNIKKHNKNNHGLSDKKIYNDSKFVCNICNKSFGHKNTLEQHQAVHTNEKKFKCKSCPFSTKYNPHLAAHKRMHEGNVHKCTMEGCQYYTP
jgi:hypothetical protein